MNRRILMLLATLVIVTGSTPSAHAFPAFARRYNIDCATCHTVPPRLNNFGIAFMRRGFKLDWDEKLQGQKATDYFAIQKQLDVVNTSTDLPDQPPPAPQPNNPATTANVTQLALLTAGPMSRQLSFYGELDYDPLATVSSVHELRAMVLFPQKLTDEGQETYYQISAGAIRPFSTWQKGLTETRGLSSPFIFDNTPVQGLSFVSDNPQLGIEFSYNQYNPEKYSHGTYASVAVLGGLNANINTGAAPVGLTPLQNGAVDYEVQLAHYFGFRNSVSLMYYSGNLNLSPADFALDSAPAGFTSHYNRLFLNGNYSPNTRWDFYGGLMIGNDDANVNPVTGNFSNTVGSTTSSGGYLQADYYFNKTVFGSLRYDTFSDSSTTNANIFAANAAGNPAGTLSNTTTGLTAAVGAQVNKFFFLTAEYQAVTSTAATPFPNPGLFVPTHTNTFTFEIKHIQ